VGWLQIKLVDDYNKKLEANKLFMKTTDLVKQQLKDTQALIATATTLKSN
jgi:hypothetical protein